MKRWIVLIILALLCVGATPAAPIGSLDEVDLALSDRLADVQIEDGQVVLATAGGEVQLTPEEFISLVEKRQGSAGRRGWWRSVFDITSPFGMVWVGVGLLGQVLFTGRMVVQWLVSEKEKKSVVPPAFWWMSLIGATMLISYFTWRQDLVGVLGQATGWLIYVRNLWMIYRPARPVDLAEPVPEKPVKSS